MSDTASPRSSRLWRAGWLAGSAACVAAMIALPGHETIPFHLIWIGLCLLYGFTVWRPREMIAVAAVTTLVTGTVMIHHAAGGYIEWAEVAEVPLSVALTAVIAAYLRRRHQAVTELAHRAAADRRRAEMRDALVRQVSHELRTPITIARGYTELVRRRCTDPLLLADTDIVLDELDKLAAITHRLVTLIRIDGDYDRHPLDLAGELERIVARWTPSAPRRWQVRADPGLVAANRDRLEAALDCLLDNAVKFTEPGDAIVVTATITAQEWTVEVADTGTGLSVQDALALTAAQTVARSPGSGTGLGLATVRTIVGAWAGTLHIAASDGGGTAVTMRFPAPADGVTSADDTTFTFLDSARSGQ